MQGAGADALKERLRSLNVLIVDDNAFMRKIVRELLADLGVRHTIDAADGIAGLDAVRDQIVAGNARQAAYYYQHAFGFEPVAYAGPETGVREAAFYVLGQGQVRLVIVTPMSPDSDFARFSNLHGDGVRRAAGDFHERDQSLAVFAPRIVDSELL